MLNQEPYSCASKLNIKVVLLAAGKSRRFNGIKQLVCVNKQGQSLLQTSFASVKTAMEKAQLSTHNLFVATGEYHADLVDHLDANLFFCSQAVLGMGHTIAQAVTNILKQDDNTSHIMICLADQVAMQPDDYQKLLDTVNKHPTKLISTLCQSGITAPGVFPKAYFDQLMQLKGDKGAKGIFIAHASELVKVSLDNAYIDIDTQADLIAWRNHHLKETLHD